jgi:hypothetical protein
MQQAAADVLRLLQEGRLIGLHKGGPEGGAKGHAHGVLAAEQHASQHLVWPPHTGVGGVTR